MIYCGIHETDHTAEEFAACLAGASGNGDQEGE